MSNYHNAGVGLRKMYVAAIGMIACIFLTVIPIVNIVALIALIAFFCDGFKGILLCRKRY